MKYATFSRLGKYGRLGNQLFQLSALLGYCRKYNRQPVILNGWEHAKFFPYFYSFFDVVVALPRTADIIKEKGFEYCDLTDSSQNVIDLFGYFQSYKYFENIQDDILKCFSVCGDIAQGLKLDFLNKVGGDISDFSAIHVRRGDYIKYSNVYVDLCNTTYYQDSLKLLDGCKFVVFSDDIEYCKPIFGDKVSYYYGNCDIDDFILMSMCKNVIAANSSFSWWASFISKNTYGEVSILPSRWFVDNIHNTKDLYFKDSIII